MKKLLLLGALVSLTACGEPPIYDPYEPRDDDEPGIVYTPIKVTPLPVRHPVHISEDIVSLPKAPVGPVTGATL